MNDTLLDRVTAAVGDLYLIGRELGRGGMSVVYEATDLRLQRRVALKVLPPELAFDGALRDRFVREAQTAARLAHPNIVPIFSVGERSSVTFFAMALVEGESLGARLARGPALTLEEARRILVDVADALAYAHARGVVHRDIKPDNILLDRESGRAMVTDFGIARAAQEAQRLTVTGVAVGTPTYMSPEQALGEREIDGRSDIYSLGVVAYQMLAGEPPFTASNSMALLMKHVGERARPIRDWRPDLPSTLGAAIDQALAKKPEQRWVGAGAFRDAISRDNVSGARRAARRQAPSPAYGAAPVAPAPAARPALPAPGTESWRNGTPAPVEGSARWTLYRQADRFRWSFLGSTALVGFLFMINLATATPPWVVFPAIALGVGLVRRWKPLRRTGIGFWSTVLRGDGAVEQMELERGMGRLELLVHRFRRRVKYAANFAIGSAVTFAVGGSLDAEPLIPVFLFGVAATIWNTVGALAKLPALRRAGLRMRAALSSDWRSRFLPTAPPDSVIGRAAADRRAILEILESLPKADRALLPDIAQTVNALVDRVASLSQTLDRLNADFSPDTLVAVEKRLAEVSAEAEGPERERRVALLERQRSSLQDLVARRRLLATQLESVELALHNLRLDLLKLRSSGVQAAIDDVTSATQEARALSRDIAHLLDAAASVRSL